MTSDQVDVHGPMAGRLASRQTTAAPCGGRRRIRAQTALLPLGAALTISGLIASRRIESLTAPQFWAEDGGFWYAEAYNEGALAPLVRPVGGYLQTFAKGAAALSQALDLALAPLFFVVAALAIQVLVPLFFLSARFDTVVPSRLGRLAIALLLVAVPNASEVHGNVTNAHVHLALLAFLVLIAREDDRPAWRAFDVFFLVLSGLSGPFCVFLVPIAFACWVHARSRWSRTRLLVLLVPTALQMAVMALQVTVARRNPIPLGASVQSLLQLVGGQVFLSGLVGESGYAQLRAGNLPFQPQLLMLIGAAGLSFLAVVFARTRSFALRALLAFAGLHLTASLLTPTVYGRAPRWELLQNAGAGLRYYYLAIVAFLCASVATLAQDDSRALRAIAGTLLATFVLIGVPFDWRHRPFESFDFPAQIARFRAAAPGERVTISIPPAPWKVKLVKR